MLKFFLHVSREEQRQRLLERLEQPAKRWKFSMIAIFGRRAIPNLHPLDLDGTDTRLEASLGRSKSRLSHLIITRLACVTLTAVNWLPGSRPIAAQKRPSPNHRPPPSDFLREVRSRTGPMQAYRS